MKVQSTKNINRRDFLKTSSAMAAIGGLGMKLYGGEIVDAFAAPAKATGQDEWKLSYCAGCIWPFCSSKVHVKDGVAVELEGNPDNPYNQGTLCLRGQAQLGNLYNPYRVKTPVKRTNPKKGRDEDPGWVEISWEEAFDTIAKKMKPVIEKDPRRFVVRMGFASSLNESRLASICFPAAVGSPNSNMIAGALCAVHYTPKVYHGTYVDKVDLQRCNYLITAGKTIGPNYGQASGPCRALPDALERGMKLVVVDPRCSSEASKGEWVPIRPATDLAFGLGFAHTMVHEIGRLDFNFLKVHTNAPYLIGEDGLYVRDLETGKPLVWDSVDQVAKTFDDPSRKDYALEGKFEIDGKAAAPAFEKLKEHLKPYTPEWAEEITSVPAATIRRLASEFVEAAQIGSTIVIDGIELPYRPVAFVAERGVASHVGGRHAHLITGLISALVGANDVPGSVIGLYPGAGKVFAQPGPDGTLLNPGEKMTHYYKGRPWEWPVNTSELKGMYPIAHSAPQMAMKVIKDPHKYGLEYEFDVMMIYGENSIMNVADGDDTIEAYNSVPFTFSIAYHYDETTLLADIVLPEASNYEREQVAESHPVQSGDDSTLSVSGVVYKRPVVDKVYDSLQSEEIVTELADRLGILYGEGGLNDINNKFHSIKPEYALDLNKRYTFDEIIDHRMKSKYGPEIGLDYLREHGMYHVRLPLSSAFYYTDYPDDQTRVPIYFHDLYAVGVELKKNMQSVGLELPPNWPEDKKDLFWNKYQPLPLWEDSHLFTAPAEFDLFVVNWRALGRNLGIGGMDDNPFLRELYSKLEYGATCFFMNTATAASKGLKNGDKVIIESQHGGKIEGQLFVTQTIHPEVIGTAGNGGRYSKYMNPVSQAGVNFNQLITAKEGFIDSTSGVIDISARVKIVKA